MRRILALALCCLSACTAPPANGEDASSAVTDAGRGDAAFDTGRPDASVDASPADATADASDPGADADRLDAPALEDAATADGGRDAEMPDDAASFDVGMDAGSCPSGAWRDPVSHACAPFTTCAAGLFVMIDGAPDHDRLCADCATGTFSSATNAPACASWTVCASGQYASAAGTGRMDRACGACGRAIGSSCARAASSAFPHGDGTFDDCGCGSGLACVVGTTGTYDIVPADGTVGGCQPLDRTLIDPDDQTDCWALGGYWSRSCCFDDACAASTCGSHITNTCHSGVNASGGSPSANVSCRDCACSDYGAPHVAGGQCSLNATNDYFPTRTDASGGGLVCACASGAGCFATSSTGDRAGNGTCCAAGQVLNGSGACVPRLSCASYPGVAHGVSGAVDLGTMCSDFIVFDDGSGGHADMACRCSTAGGYFNEQCLGDTSSMRGSCMCVPSTCLALGSGTWPDGCGGMTVCP